jgi:tetratricopeptide (TPR) repeat protein
MEDLMAKHGKKDLKHDEFKETIENIIIFYEHHKKTVIWGAIGILALFILFFTYRNNKITKFEKSKDIYNIGVILYNNGNFAQAREKFQLVVDDYWGTIFANRSTYMLADLSYKEGKIDDALLKFQAFVNEKYDEFFTPSAYEGIGQCYEQEGNFEKAIENYEIAVSKYKDNIGKAYCLMSLARLYLNMQRIDEAKKTLLEILGISEDIELRGEAERKLKLIQVQEEINE